MKTAMLTSFGLSMVAAAAFASQSATEPAPKESAPGKSCCAKKSAGEPMKCEKPAPAGDTARHEGHAKDEGRAKQETQKMRCSLTGKVVDTCCCVEREGKTHCTLAGKDVAECCCTPVKDEAPAKDEKSASAKTN